MSTYSRPKTAESQALAKDVERFLEQGGKIQKLPGFGTKSTLVPNAKRYNFGDIA